MGHVINLDEEREKIQPPEIVVDGKRYVGRPLNHERWVRVAQRLEGAQLYGPELTNLVRDLIDEVFGKPLFGRLSRKVLALPPGLMLQTVKRVLSQLGKGVKCDVE